MRRTFAVLAVAAIAAVAFLAGSRFQALAQDKPPEGMPDLEKMMEMYRKAAEPGEPHRRLAARAGSWVSEGELLMGPTSQKTTGTSTARAILGGRYLIEEMKGDFMGETLEGLGITGYDNVAKEYQSIWIDSMSTAIFMSTGTADEAGKTITFKGTMRDALTPQGRDFRLVLKDEGPDSYTFEMYETPPETGKEALTMRSLSKRKR